MHADAELWAYLRSIDLSVIPYAFGTHSGWVEACYDLGTAVLAPRTGYWTEQQRCHTFGWRPGEGPVRDDVIRAVAEAYAARPVTPASRVERETQRQAVSAAHGQIYRAVFAAGTRATGGVGVSPVIGWYAHHVGAGHVARACLVGRQMRTPVVILSSRAAPTRLAGGAVGDPSAGRRVGRRRP